MQRRAASRVCWFCPGILPIVTVESWKNVAAVGHIQQWLTELRFQPHDITLLFSKDGYRRVDNFPGEQAMLPALSTGAEFA
jgi:hypothetical protein